MRYIPFFLLLAMIIVSCRSARYASITPGSITTDRKQYIDRFGELAISEMNRTGIPASITLAQGLLESDNGNSTLAVKANNHFGIKCHDEWKGQRIYHDDDRRNECFRKYESAWESYRDHSDFLRNRQRYAFLFELEPTDYKGWAKGLKKSGYATNREYAELLIRIIEENNLQVYDRGIVAKTDDPVDQVVVSENQHETDPEKYNSEVTDIDNFTVDLNPRSLAQINRIDYVVVKPGDTFIELAEEFELMYWELFKYNELSKDAAMEPGQILFLQPKRNKAEFGCDYHTVEEGETMYSISQKYGVKLARLCKMNWMEEGEEPAVGQKLWLRKVKPVSDGAEE
jgi:LysM repeat protein